MAVTLKQIAEIAGVSRGTVDRALHNRGRVSPEVAERVRQIAQDLGYQPNEVGQALARSRRQIKLGVVLQSAETPTMKIVAQGVRQAAQTLEKQGIEVLFRPIESVDAMRELECLDELLTAGIHGLAIAPADDPSVCERLGQIAERDIPIITFNADLPQSKRMCFVGQDNDRAGRTAAGLMAMMVPQNGTVAAITGHLCNDGHRARCGSFADELSRIAPGITLLPVQPCFDRDDCAYELTCNLLREHPELSAIYVAANGQHGVCEALRAAELDGTLRVIAYDVTRQNIDDLKQGAISILIDQKAQEQGYRPLMLLRDYLFSGTLPNSEFYYTGITLKTRYNL